MTDHNEAPADLTPPRGLTPQMLDLLNQLSTRGATVSEPGEMLVDVNGTPHAVAPPRVTHAAGAVAVVAASDLARLGITVDQAQRRWPNVRVIDPDPDTDPPAA